MLMPLRKKHLTKKGENTRTQSKKVLKNFYQN